MLNTYRAEPVVWSITEYTYITERYSSLPNKELPEMSGHYPCRSYCSEGTGRMSGHDSHAFHYLSPDIPWIRAKDEVNTLHGGC